MAKEAHSSTRRNYRNEIYEIIKKSKKISINEIKNSTKINYNTIRSALIKLTKDGLIERIDRGIYRIKG